jgi:hypothetical protein
VQASIVELVVISSHLVCVVLISKLCMPLGLLCWFFTSSHHIIVLAFSSFHIHSFLTLLTYFLTGCHFVFLLIVSHQPNYVFRIIISSSHSPQYIFSLPLGEFFHHFSTYQYSRITGYVPALLPAATLYISLSFIVFTLLFSPL